MKFIEHFLVVAAIFVVIDGVWLKFIANKFYKKQIGGLMSAKPRFGAAALFYALSIWAIIYLALDPALAAGSLSVAIKHGALLGLAMYGTYDLTNLATLKKWPLKVTIVDMAWGTFVTAAVTAIAFAIFR